VAILLACGCHQARSAVRRSESDSLSLISAEELFRIGLFHARRGDLLRAEQYLNAAREHGHDEAATVYWLVRVCVSAGRFRSALRHSASYLRDHPDNWRLRVVVASIHEALGDFHEAQLNLERVVASKPGEALAHYKLALLYHRQTPLPERAGPHLRAYLELAPEGPHAAEARELEAELAAEETP
jgi:tetratricopeptide (TPR) repeat protein